MGTKTHEVMTDAEVKSTFYEIAQGVGCISCIAEERKAGESPQGLNIGVRYMKSGSPGYEALGDQIPETD